MLKIIIHPNKILRNISAEVDISGVKSGKFLELIKEMTETMKEKDGVGLAAPQIGENLRLIIVVLDKVVITMINPQITKKSWAKDTAEEGCLSIPKTYGKVERHKQINCVYFDENGKKQKLKLKNLNARIIQHEVDHLDGVLFIDKLIDD